jgi:hypothetical protein
MPEITRATIYEDPITRRRLEGRAVVLDQADRRDGYKWVKCVFVVGKPHQGEEPIVSRMVHESQMETVQVDEGSRELYILRAAIGELHQDPRD